MVVSNPLVLFADSVQLKQKIIGAYEALKKAIFIIASCLIIFVALRNSIMW